MVIKLGIHTSEDEILILLPYSDGRFRLEMLEDVVRQLLDWSLAYFTVKDIVGDRHMRVSMLGYVILVVDLVLLSDVGPKCRVVAGFVTAETADAAVAREQRRPVLSHRGVHGAGASDGARRVLETYNWFY